MSTIPACILSYAYPDSGFVGKVVFLKRTLPGNKCFPPFLREYDILHRSSALVPRSGILRLTGVDPHIVGLSITGFFRQSLSCCEPLLCLLWCCFQSSGEQERTGENRENRGKEERAGENMGVEERRGENSREQERTGEGAGLGVGVLHCQQRGL